MSGPRSRGVLKPAYLARQGAFTHEECRSLAARLLDSELTGTNQLSVAFEGSSGFQAVFRRDGLDGFRSRLPMLGAFFESAAAPESNAFFVNALIVHSAFEVKPHLDCSLDTFLPTPTAPERVSVLYVHVPEDLTGGALQLHGKDGCVSEITPSLGLLVQFHGDTVHGVSEGRTKCQRISVVMEEYRLDKDHLAFVPRFSLEPALHRTPARDAYDKVREFMQTLTSEERGQLRMLAADQFPATESNSSE